MDLARGLAELCVKEAMRKHAFDDETLSESRSRFEHSIGREQALRRHAERLKTLAAQRAEEEDTSVPGYAGTFAKRIAPIPQTVGEAAWRLPAIAAGGVGGHLYGKHMEALDKFNLEALTDVVQPKDVEKIFSPMKDSDKALEALGTRFGKGQPLSPDAMKELRALQYRDPKDIAAALQRKQVVPLSSEQEQIRQVLQRVGGGKEEALPYIRQEVGKMIRSGARPGKPPLINISTPEFKPYRLGGALAGMGIASVLTGLPLAIRALMQKGQGGEAAVRARTSMQEAIDQAQAEADKREQILSTLPPKKAALAPMVARIVAEKMTEGGEKGKEEIPGKATKELFKDVDPGKKMGLEALQKTLESSIEEGGKSRQKGATGPISFGG
jgi:hypothetical protein